MAVRLKGKSVNSIQKMATRRGQLLKWSGPLRPSNYALLHFHPLGGKSRDIPPKGAKLRIDIVGKKK